MVIAWRERGQSSVGAAGLYVGSEELVVAAGLM